MDTTKDIISEVLEGTKAKNFGGIRCYTNWELVKDMFLFLCSIGCRVSSLTQTGERFKVDENGYDKVILDKVSGTVPFKDREGGKEITEMVRKGLLTKLVLEELSRCGRNTGDVITTLQWLDDSGVNVVVRNIGLESRPNGKRNPIWKMITSIMSSLYEMELENIKERTHYGRVMYVRNGGKLGRPKGSTENERGFLNKPQSKEIQKYLQMDLSLREISRLVECSVNTVRKVRKSVIS